VASINLTPTPDIQRGIEVLEQDLPRVLKGRSVEQVGWCRLDQLTLLVPFYAKSPTCLYDFYLLKLNFSCYPEWPPSAQFVNPSTLNYTPGTDKKWLPLCEGTNEIYFHDNYSNQGKQLICCSASLEFYEVRHSLSNPAHIWQHPHQNFSATIAAIDFGLRPDFYRGPQATR
jgi:hypothetical protein